MTSPSAFRRKGIKFSIDANMSLIPLLLGNLSSPVSLLLIWISCITFFFCCQIPFRQCFFEWQYLVRHTVSPYAQFCVLPSLKFNLICFFSFPHDFTSSLHHVHKRGRKICIDMAEPWEESLAFISTHFSFIPHSLVLIAYLISQNSLRLWLT